MAEPFSLALRVNPSDLTLLVGLLFEGVLVELVLAVLVELVELVVLVEDGLGAGLVSTLLTVDSLGGMSPL